MDHTLKRLGKFSGRKGPLLLVIMDGIGIGPQDERNAVYMAKTPVLDSLMQHPMRTQLRAHGPAVGLPTDGDMGNSEVGHNALGAGRVFDQGAKLVNRKLSSGDMFRSDLWRKILERSSTGGTVHFIGLLSDGNVHSHTDHLNALVKNCAESGVKSVCVHILTDGRDVGERTALQYIEPLQQLLDAICRDTGFNYRIASGGGRMKVTMDRYKADWNIVKRGWDAHVHGIGRKFSSAGEAVRTMYDESDSINDQFLDPFVITGPDGEPAGRITDGDSVVFFNFRGDRAIEISMAFENEDFNEFDRRHTPDVLYTGMLQYDGDLNIPRNFLVDPPKIDKTIGEYLCEVKVESFAISETQKYGHVTYFWNGNRSGYIDDNLEDYVEIPSDKIEFQEKPEMKADEITDKVIELLNSGKYSFGRVNYANGDMVGHTGYFDAAVTAVEAVDRSMGRLIETVDKLGGITVITADHGNADEMYKLKNGNKTLITSHTLNPVPFIIKDSVFNSEYSMADIENPGLSNVAATLLNLLGFKKVDEYDPSLIKFT